jgi:hypothetical protein
MSLVRLLGLSVSGLRFFDQATRDEKSFETFSPFLLLFLLFSFSFAEVFSSGYCSVDGERAENMLAREQSVY